MIINEYQCHHGSRALNRTSRTAIIRAVVGLWAAGVLITPVPFGADTASPARRAAELYAAGDYAGALPLLEQVAASDDADGPSLYRLYFCQDQTGSAAARDTMRRALGVLESEVESGGSLESAFYLSNTYRNLGQHTKAKEVAAKATTLVEQRTWKPSGGTELFRVGKMYADQDQSDQAAEWYQKALGALDTTQGGESATYASHAHRYLGTYLESQGRSDEALDHFVALLDDSDGSQEEFDRLATTLARSGRYRDAARAWNKALLASPATGNRARYAQRVAVFAANQEPLPVNAPNGSSWDQVDQAGLEQVLFDQAKAVRAIQQQVKDNLDATTREQRERLTQQIDEIKPIFAAAALEYLLRGHSLRELSFRSGYATMVFRDSDWQLPQRPRRRRRGKAPANEAAAQQATEGKQ